LDPVVTTTAYALSLLAAGACVVALAIPAYRSARTFNESYIAQGRQQTRGYAQRVGIDVALLVLAAAAVWQLQTHGVELSRTVRGRFGFDPLLIAAPALGLLAGAVLALRVVPLLAGLAERVARRQSCTVPALSAWQVARRPLRYSRAALLLTMAVSVGFFAASYATTWSVSQDDQAAFQVGADARFVPNRAASAITDLDMRSVLESRSGVERSIPMRSLSGRLGTVLGARFFLIDAAAAAEVVTIREDLSSEPFPQLMQRLSEGRPRMATIPLGGEPTWISVRANAECVVLDEFDPPCRPGDLKLVLQDGDGLLHRVDLGTLPTDGTEVRLSAPLTRDLGDGFPAAPAYPLSLAAVEVGVIADFEQRMTVDLHGIEITESSDEGPWHAGPTLGEVDWLTRAAAIPTLTTPDTATVSEDPGSGSVSMVLSAGFSPDARIVTFNIQPPAIDGPETIPLVISDSVLEELGLGLGDRLTLDDLRIPPVEASIVGSVTEFPTVPPGTAHSVILDLPTIQMLGYAPGRPIDQPGEYWLAVEPGAGAAVASSLTGEPVGGLRVSSRADVATGLRTDPIALGTIALLSLGFVAAAILAGVGFIVSAIAAAKERVGEFTLLRALGLSRGQLSAWLSIEQAALALLGLVFGTLVGLLLVSVVMPLITVTQRGEVTFPDLLVIYPLSSILIIDVAVMFVLVLVVVALSVVIRRQGLATQLRIGDV
jgi:hypothetical protein